VFLGDQLSEILDAIEEEREPRIIVKCKSKSVHVGGTSIDLKVATLPSVARDKTDRNRTSPFAFTGSKFEFRAVGSKQSPSFPMTVLNAAVSSSLTEITAALEQKKGGKATPLEHADILSVLRVFIQHTKSIRFEGNGYSNEWAVEAAKRGLPNLKNSLEAYQMLVDPTHQHLLVEECEIFSTSELASRYHVLLEKYEKEITIESQTLFLIIQQQVLPALRKNLRDLSTGCTTFQQVHPHYPREQLPGFQLMIQLAALECKLNSDLQQLLAAMEPVSLLASPCPTEEDNRGVQERAVAAKALLPIMQELRKLCDEAELLLPDETWPMPKYMDIFFI
jgi:glutamine synthetase